MKSIKSSFTDYITFSFCTNAKFIYAFCIFFLGPFLSVQGKSTPTIIPKNYLSGNLSPKIVLGDTVNIPRKVKPEHDGTLRLKASAGRAIGPDIKFMPEWKAFGWFTAKDHVEWEVKVTKKGEYDVYLEWSVSDKEAGKPFVFETRDKKLIGTVGKTGSWETFKTEKIGRLQLSRGLQTMKFKPDSEFEKGALLDLREVKLVPVK